MEPKITTKPAFQIIGLQFRGNNDNNECPKLWDSFIQRFEEVKPLATNPITAFGVCADFDMQKNIFTYSAGLQVDNTDTIPEDMVSVSIPEQEYAVFECTLPSIMNTIDKIYKEWLPESKFKRADGPEFELYPPDFDPDKPESPIFIYIPIIKN